MESINFIFISIGKSS